MNLGSLMEAELNQEELRYATLYWREEMYEFEPVPVQRKELEVTKHGPCNGDCDNHSPNSSLFRYISNDITKTEEALHTHLSVGLLLDCPKCSERHLGLSEALSYHAYMLKCNKMKDSQGALQAARKRCDILKGLGYKII